MSGRCEAVTSEIIKSQKLNNVSIFTNDYILYVLHQMDQVFEHSIQVDPNSKHFYFENDKSFKFESIFSLLEYYMSER